MTGYLEPIGVIREAESGKGDLVLLWLDLAIAYGSVRDKLVGEDLGRYYGQRNLIQDQYSDSKIKTTSGLISTDWRRLKRDVINGFTISVILFTLTMNMSEKSAKVKRRGLLMRNRVRRPPIRTYMNDMAVAVPGCRWILQSLEKIIRRKVEWILIYKNYLKI